MSIINKLLDFVKSLFGGDTNINKEAGVQIEQVSAPYKVPEPAVATLAPVPTVVEEEVSVLTPEPSWPFPGSAPEEAVKSKKPVAAIKTAPKAKATKSTKPKTDAKAPAKPRVTKPKAAKKV